MNLHQIVSGAIGAVNPFVIGTITPAMGYTTNPDGSQVPSYGAPFTGPMQIQALTEDDLRKMEGLNIQSDTQAIFLNGQWNGVVRPDGKGGDLVTYNGQNWLVVTVSESWPDWTKIIVVRQI